MDWAVVVSCHIEAAYLYCRVRSHGVIDLLRLVSHRTPTRPRENCGIAKFMHMLNEGQLCNVFLS
jgi:hypothetical protein